LWENLIIGPSDPTPNTKNKAKTKTKTKMSNLDTLAVHKLICSTLAVSAHKKLVLSIPYDTILTNFTMWHSSNTWNVFDFYKCNLFDLIIELCL